MPEVWTVLALGVVGGVFGVLFNETWMRLRRRARRRRHRGEHRPVWRRPPRIDPYESTDVPLQGLSSDAPTGQIPMPGGGVDHSQGEQ